MAIPWNPYKLFCYKDERHVVIKCSKETLRCSGFQHEDKVLGKTDYDFPWCDLAEIYHRHEDDVISGNVYSTLIPLKDHQGNTSIFLHNKYCEYTPSGHFLHLVCYATELINPRVYDLTHLLIKNRKTADANPVYAINKQVANIVLTDRQQQCLFLLLHGKSANQIATILGISRRTVETHLEIIKQKLNCNTKAELYDQAIALGYLNILPSGLMLNKLVAGLK